MNTMDNTTNRSATIRMTCLLATFALLGVHAATAELGGGPVLIASDDQRDEPGGDEAGAGRSDDSKKANGAGAKPARSEPAAPIWIPRTRQGAPASRIGGATRTVSQSVRIATLVPAVDEAAVTAAATPTLYWYLDSPIAQPVNFTLVSDQAIDPVVDVLLPPPHGTGIHSIELEAYGVALSPGTQYEWYVAVVWDEANRATDIVARGALARVDVDDLAPEKFAEAGLWYEALDQVLRSQRAGARAQAFLEQVGLEFAVGR